MHLRAWSLASALAIAITNFVACSSGNGPIGVEPIGAREIPRNMTASAPPDNEPRPERGDDDDDDDSDNARDAAAAPPPDAGSVAPSLVDACSGAYDCQADGGTFRLTLERAADCRTTVNGVVVIVSAAGTFTTTTGQVAAVWEGTRERFTFRSQDGVTRTCSLVGGP